MTLQAYLDKLEALSIREQLLVGATLLVFVGACLQFFVLDPLLGETQRLASQVRAIESNVERQQQTLAGEGLTPMLNRQKKLQTEINSLADLLAKDQEEIEQYTATLVPAKRMPALLQMLLERESVDLVSLTNLPPVPLIEGTEERTAATQLYQHGIELKVRGDFHTLRRYLEAIEEQPWKLLWQGVRLESTRDGENVMELHLQTLSTDSAWLGV